VIELQKLVKNSRRKQLTTDNSRSAILCASSNPKRLKENMEAIRQALLETILEINVNGIFAKHFVKLSQGNDTVEEVVLNLNEDLHRDYKTLGLLEEGFGNLRALQVLTIRFLSYEEPYTPPRDQGSNCLDQASMRGMRETGISLYWKAVTGILHRVPNYIDLRLDGDYSEVVNYTNLAVAIQGVPTIRTFHSGDAFPWESANTIMSALASLPSLDDVILAFDCDYCRILACKFRGLKKLLKSPSLRSIELSKVPFTSAVSRALLAAFEEGSFVTDLRFTHCYFGARVSGDQTGTINALVQALQRNTSVKTLCFAGDNFHELFCEGITTVLLVNTTLEDLTLRNKWTDDGGRWLQPLFAAMRINSSVKSLDVDKFRLTDELVCGALRDALASNSVLESLTLHFRGRLDGASVFSWRKTLPFIRDNATLKSLTIVITSGHVLDPYVTNLCIDTLTMLEGNTSLECLNIKSSGISAGSYFAALECLQPSTALKTLRLSVKVDASMAEEEMKMNQVVSIVKKNYSLAVLDKGVSAHDKTGELGTLLRLNQAGRRYLIKDTASISKGVEVLIGVSDDVGCLFYHLLENPTLCDIEHQNIKKSRTGANLKKRQRIQP
jgi:hypothetical protein